MTIATNEDFYVLVYDAQYVKENIANNKDEDGLEQAFDLEYEIHE